ncbi:MAG TPA: RND family transporter [Dehalococcoidia bacterium]|nr:RND family transporter [Dehalococcoidia bacterium]
MERIAKFIYTRSRLIIVLVAILNIVALVSFFHFKIDTDFLSFFTSGNPKAEEFDRLNEKYQSGETVSVLIEQDNSLLDKESFQKVFRLQEEIEELDGISQVQSFIPSEIYMQGHIIQVDEKFIERHSDLLEDFIEEKYFLTEQFLSSDNSKGVLIVNLELDGTAGEVVQSLEEIAQKQEGMTLSLAGNEIIEDTVRDYLLRILFILPPCAIGLVLLVFYLILRSRRFTIMAIIPAGFAALWTIGTIFWSGQELNLVTVLSPIFVIVMGAADGLHYTSHFMDNMSRYSDSRQLTVETLRMVGMPIFLTTITTMAGFASLTWTEVLPMRQMGIFVSLGIGYAGVLSLFFLPAVMSKMKLPPRPPHTQESRLAKLILVASKHRAMIIVIFLAIVVVSALNIPRLEVVSNQLMFFKEDSQIRQTFNKVEKHFGGALPLTAEIVSNRGTDTLRDYKLAEDILDIERELERLPGIQSAASLFDMVASINEMTTGRGDYPENPQLVQRILMQIDDDDLETWVSDDGLRMMIRTEDLDSIDIGRLEDFVAENPQIRVVSGMPVLFDEMNKLVVQSQIRSLGLALALIFIMLLVTIRKLRAALVAMLPIVITIAAILGMLSMTEFHLNIMTANLSAIAIGVGVDYSIHLISGIYYFRKRGLGSIESVDSALSSLSRPILANAFGLAIGLSILFFSPLRIHMQAASVMWVAMVVSSMGALLLIPIFYSRRTEQPEKRAI